VRYRFMAAGSIVSVPAIVIFTVMAGRTDIRIEVAF
jgi:hypothetical protein